MDDLAALMSRYVGGDAQAFAAFYQGSAPAILAYLIRMAGRRDVAEDVLQETYIKVHRSRSSYVVGANPMPWLYAIAHRTFLDHVRKSSRRRDRVERAAKETENKAHLTGVPISDYHQPDPAAGEAIRQALTRLKESQRQALVLTKIEGKSLAQAAAIAGTSVGAMKLRVHRGMNRLRTLLVDDD
ncbi:MAG: RNA polymerase sigma factor [Deltaproteobacteria bacterium]|nr:RNA polymerase sigma factor [Deltaproteobacteria bacterium]